jgi:hypothetical protein
MSKRVVQCLCFGLEVLLQVIFFHTDLTQTKSQILHRFFCVKSAI